METHHATRASPIHHQQYRQEKAVILPIREYQRLLEDLHDLTVVAEYPVSLDEMKKRLTDHAPV